tara:strand:- start:1563 stop:2588 length:1026 start_codon:yes stop_codon:yes gene_type:complete
MFKNSDLNSYIIAEAGVNHNGSIEKAIKLVEEAKNSQCDAVKFQTFNADRLICKNTRKISYQIKNDDKERSQYEMLSDLMLSDEEFIIIKNACETNKIDFISTPYDSIAVDFLDKIGMKIFKVASADIIDPLLNSTIASTGKDVIISTGMANEKEINNCLGFYKKYNKNQICLLHCVSNYPCSNHSLNLKCVSLLKDLYKTKVGFSDHTTNSISSSIAISLGASVIEKHFTLDTKDTGPDHISSLNPREMKTFVANLRESEMMLGKPKKTCQPEELEMRSIARKKIVTKNKVKRSELISLENVTLKRNEKGLEASHLFEIIGKKFSKDLDIDFPINLAEIK